MPSFLMCGDCRPSRDVGRSLPMRSLRVKWVGRCSERGGGGDDDVRGWAVVVVVIDSGFLPAEHTDPRVREPLVKCTHANIQSRKILNILIDNSVEKSVSHFRGLGTANHVMVIVKTTKMLTTKYY